MRHIYSTYKEHYKALIFLGLPIVIGQIGVIVLGFADTLMIGHHSTIELGAASFVNNVFTLAIIFSTGFSYGLTPIVGGLYGTHQYAPAGQALRNSLLANLMVALLLTICMTICVIIKFSACMKGGKYDTGCRYAFCMHSNLSLIHISSGSTPWCANIFNPVILI